MLYQGRRKQCREEGWRHQRERQHQLRQKKLLSATHNTRDRGTFKRQDRIPYGVDNFTSLNTRPERIFKEVFHSKLIPNPLEPRFNRMGLDQNAWCKYHRIKGHTTDDYIHLKRDIEKLIQDGKLSGYVKGNHVEERRLLEEPNKDRKDDRDMDQK